MSREAPPPRRARKSRTLDAALDDFAAEKKAARTATPPGRLMLVAAVCLAGAFMGGLFLFAHGGASKPAVEDAGKVQIAYISMDEIKANASQVAENTSKPALPPPGPDSLRADARSGAQTIDGLRARVVRVEIEREFTAGMLVYRRRDPLLKVTVGFELGIGQPRTFTFDPKQFPLARLTDDIGRPYPQLELGGFHATYSGTLRTGREDVTAYYFDLPAKPRPLNLDCCHPVLGKRQAFRFHIPASMYDGKR